MAEHFAAEIRIGGPVRQRHVTGLCQAIHDADVELDWGSDRFIARTAEYLLNNLLEVDGVNVLRLCDDDARWGQFESLEQFLIRCKIPFDRLTEGKWEYAPEWVVFRPGAGVRVVLTNNHRQPIVPVDGLYDVLAELVVATNQTASGDHQAVLQVVRSAHDRLKRILPAPIPLLPSFEIIYPESKQRKATNHDHRNSPAGTAPRAGAGRQPATPTANRKTARAARQRASLA